MKGLKKEQSVVLELEEVLAAVSKDRALLHDFLTDLLTPGEYQEIATRWQIVKQLVRGVPQRDIMKSLGVAAATVTRGSRVLLNPAGGFRRVLQRLGKRA